MINTVNHLQDIANHLAGDLFHTWYVEGLHRDKTINDRQYLILNQLARDEALRNKQILNAQIWYENLYKKLGGARNYAIYKKWKNLS